MFTRVVFPLIALFWPILQTVHCRELASRNSEVSWASIVDSRGNRLPDFSFCGYQNSEIPLPTIKHEDITISIPKKFSDDVGPILQQAINAVAYNGGGVVRLPSGRMYITAGIHLHNNVIVTGNGKSGTTLVLKRQPSKPVFTLGRLGPPPKAILGFRSRITNTYVPIGASIISVSNNTGFIVGQHVYISRPVTESWVRNNGMADLIRDGVSQEWIPVGKQIMSPNVIKAIRGKQITLQVPITDNLNAAYMNPELRAYTPPEIVSEMGIQNLRIEVPKTCSGAPLANLTCNYPAVRFASWTVNSWARGLALVGFNNFFDIQRDASRITIQDVTMSRDKDIEGRALPTDILVRGYQVLIQDCQQIGLDKARSFSVMTDSLTPGPNAITRYTAQSGLQRIEPHERWSWGLLVEESAAPTKLGNRGSMGTGHGWTMNAGVGWNLRTDVNFESPPLGINWCVGCGGQEIPSGNATFIDSSSQVEPRSLFAAQLKARGVHWYERAGGGSGAGNRGGNSS